MKRIIAITLAMLVVLSALICSFTVSAASGITLTYSFTGDEASKAGFAEGTISLKVNDSASAGNYYLYWADNTKALDGYRQIATLNVANGATGTYKMLDHTAIPPKATQIVAFKANSAPSNKTVSSAAGTYAIPSNKQATSSTKFYSYGAFSDPQIANDSYGSSSYPYDETHWKQALETYTSRNVSFLVSSGDIVNDQNGGQTYAAEYKAYQKILADSSFTNPVYECNGNHDVHVNWKGSDPVLNKPFVMGTGLDSKLSTIKTNKAYFEITEPITGDHFIFMAQEGGFYTNQGEQFTTAQLDWLEGLLKKYANDGKNIFIMEHANVEGWGSGDKASSPYYYDLGMKKTQSSTARFIKLMETYKKCVIITGHTHLELGAHLNYSDNNSTSAVMMHNSAVGGVRRLVNGSVDRTAMLGMSEGYVVDVYEDYTIFNGINLYYNEVMPDCTYIIPNTTSLLDPDAPIPTEPQPLPTTPTPTTPTPTQPVNSGDVTAGYYLVGDLNGKTYWDAASLTADRKLKVNPNTAGEYYLEWTFYAGDELKVVYYNGSSIEKWYNDGGDNYKIGAGTDKVGFGTIYFNPNGRSDWSYQWFTVKSGGSGIVDPKPTETQAPKPTQTEAPKPTQTEEPKPTQPQEPSYGDTDLDGKISIVDATTIQRKCAQIIELYGEQIANADVDGDNEISVVDATHIQRHIAKIIDKFPVEEKNAKAIASTGAGDVDTLIATAKADLSKHYTFSSFDQFMALKKCVKQLESSGDKSQDAYDKLEKVYNDFWVILEGVGVATGDTIDVYFTNIPNWSTVNAYAWNSSSNNSWPGEAMELVETNSMGQKIYKITFETGKYDNIIFNNGSTQTVDLALSNINNEGFYTTSQSGGKYLCETYVYGE